MKSIKIKLVLSGLILLFTSMLGVAQNDVTFTYDDSGNRISRSITAEKIQTDSTQLEIPFEYKNDISDENNETEEGELLDSEGLMVKILPNPNGGQFAIKIEGWQSSNEIKFILRNLNGVIIDNGYLKNSATDIDISDKPDGTYILTILLDNKKEVWKIIKR